MALVNFFEKPGCANNSKQKALLRGAGHTVVEHNLLAEPWTADSLRPFFGEWPVADWFNRAAPDVKNGMVIPEAVSEAQALALMCQTPLLIRRPLMEVAGLRRAGFDFDQVQAWIGLVPEARVDGLETCAKQDKGGRPGCP
jgi:nitrogenase-associated protein